MKRKKQARPHLTADVVADEQLLVGAVEALLMADQNMVRHQRRIIRRQGDLRRAADNRAWKAYLKVEEAVNARYDLALRLVAAWAFEQGRRCRR